MQNTSKRTEVSAHRRTCLPANHGGNFFRGDLTSLRFDAIDLYEQAVALQASLFRGGAFCDIHDFDQLGFLRVSLRGDVFKRGMLHVTVGRNIVFLKECTQVVDIWRRGRHFLTTSAPKHNVHTPVVFMRFTVLVFERML